MISKTKNQSWRIILAATIGNALEWYDFIVYGFLAATLGKLFFPTGDPRSSMLLATLSIGIGFIARPIGAIVFGLLSDRYGRKFSLNIVILLMFVSTAMITFTPTYLSIGLWASVLISIARLLQGFSTGGEFGAATAYLIESAPAEKRDFFGSWQMFAQASGALLSTLVGALLFYFFSQQTVESWAWRLPFALGLLIGPVGMYIRKNMHEVEEPKSSSKKIGFIYLVKGYGVQLIAGTFVSAAVNVMSYVIITYLPLYAKQTLGISNGDAFLALLLAIIIRMILIPVFGLVSDKIGRDKLLISSLSIFSLIIYPSYFYIINHPSFGSLFLVESIFAVLIAGVYAPSPSYMSELFPSEVRGLGLSISYNIAATIFGGFSLFFVSLIQMYTGSALAPAHYCFLFFVLAIISVFKVRTCQSKVFVSKKIN